MLFNSWGYLLFLALVVPLHWLVPHGRWRIGLLGFASVLFYSMWRWEFSLLVLFSACLDYVAAARIHAARAQGTRRAWLLASLVVNLGLLVLFKYTYFIWDNVSFVAGFAGAEMPALEDLGVRILLPLGISFYTFQTISYTIDVYRGVCEPTRSFLSFLTYVTFWPQLIAGPVLRASEVIPQLEERRRFSSDDLYLGLSLVVLGLFKKMVLADGLAPMVDEAFSKVPGTLNALDVWVATYLFGFQIYFDFAGYSTVALGSALLVGLRFPANFDWPYVARSPREFWQRWHISLSSWIRDYLYLPLTGQRFRTDSTGGIAVATEARTQHRNRALLLTWLIMGLWHGAAWTFVLWGLYHAGLILLYRVVPFLRVLPERVPVVAHVVMLFLSMAGWIFFRAQSVEQALTFFGRILDPRQYGFSGRSVDIYSYLWAGLTTLGMFALWGLLRLHARRPFPRLVTLVASGASLAVMVCAILACMRQVKQFIYFQF